MGSTPPIRASPPAPAIPAASPDSSIGPDSRVSRINSTCGRGDAHSAVAARPERHGQLGGQQVAGDPTDAVGSEELRGQARRSSAC